MLRDALRSLWTEQRVPDPPRRVWRDWALLLVLVPTAMIEGALREDLVWHVLSVVVGVALVPTILWRRTHPLATVVVAFGALTVVEVVSLLVDVDWQGLDTNVFVLLLLYALFRWASGRHAVMGLAVVALPFLLSAFDPDIHDRGSNIAVGGLVLAVTAAVGASVRYADKSTRRGVDQIKLLEREQLARELHDTVAHHVSAIAIRAQAGQVVAAHDPDAAVQALAVIEQEASRALAEMRTMVGALRDGEEPDLTPQRGIVQIEELATHPEDRPRVEVDLEGDLDDLQSSVNAALYRMAQESVTNALRHARHASRVSVEVRGDRERIRLVVRDDGDPGGFDPWNSAGFGLVGMAERAKLLGGTLTAGPNPNGGWTVEAVLPRGAR